MTQSEYIDVSVEESIMRIRLNRPARKNALTQEMYAAIITALTDADKRDEVRIVVIHADETCFSAGNDLDDFDSRDFVELSNAIKMLLVMHDLKKPLMAAVSGIAIGIGATMLLHCDIVYAADDTRFRLPFVNLGVCPEGASSLLLPTVTGHRVASELLLFGDFFDCESARLCGLVNRSMPAQELLDYTLKRALQLSNQPQKALLESKRLTKSHTYDAIKACLLDEARVFGQLLKTEESLAIREKMLG